MIEFWSRDSNMFVGSDGQFQQLHKNHLRDEHPYTILCCPIQDPSGPHGNLVRIFELRSRLSNLCSDGRTYSTTAEPSVGELRFIARLSRSALPNGITVADINGGTAIEASDVYLLNGQTRSKCKTINNYPCPCNFNTSLLAQSTPRCHLSMTLYMELLDQALVCPPLVSN